MDNIKIKSIRKLFNKNKLIDNILKIKKYEDKFNYIISFNNFLIKMDENIKKTSIKIKNCNTVIFINVYLKKNKIFLYIFSESIILNSLISIMCILLNNISIKNINNINIKNIFIILKIEKIFNLDKFNIIYEIEDIIKKKINSFNK